MKSILVGYEDTEPAQRALARAAELAAAFGAKLTVVGVAPALVPAGRGIGPIDPADPPELHREELRHAAQFLADKGIESEYQVLLGDPATAIAELAEKSGADLIVVGTREPSFVSRLLGGSVSGAVGRKAHCDVLIVH